MLARILLVLSGLTLKMGRWPLGHLSFQQAVPPPVALLDAYQSSFQICYASNIMHNCRICNKYFEGKEMNGVETLYYA
jgi:hypothetical protein